MNKEIDVLISCLLKVLRLGSHIFINELRHESNVFFSLYRNNINGARIVSVIKQIYSLFEQAKELCEQGMKCCEDFLKVMERGSGGKG